MGDECRGEDVTGACIDKEEALKLKVVGIVVILAVCVGGVCVPLLGQRFRAMRPEGNVFFVLKAFAAGVILGTAFIHMLPEAFEALSNPCLLNSPQGAAWANFPFAGFIAMISALLTLVIEFLRSSSAHSNHSLVDPSSATTVASSDKPVVPPQSHNIFLDQEHQESGKTLSRTLQLRYQTVSQVLEVGIVAHSVIIGIALGASNSLCTVRPLVAALTFHQFFEGIALGGCIAQAGFKRLSSVIMAIFFSITTPLGIGIGIAISSSYNENSPRALMVQGVFDSISAGILVYMSLVDLIATDFLAQRLRSSKSLQFFAFSALFLGTGAMSLIAKWA